MSVLRIAPLLLLALLLVGSVSAYLTLDSCDASTTSNECLSHGCYWFIGNSTCIINCDQFEHSGDCANMEDYGCSWSSTLGLCVYTDDWHTLPTPSTTPCTVYATPSTCQAQFNCFWDAPSETSGDWCRLDCETLTFDSMENCVDFGRSDQGCFHHLGADYCGSIYQPMPCELIVNPLYCPLERCETGYDAFANRTICYNPHTADCTTFRHMQDQCEEATECSWGSDDLCHYVTTTTLSPVTNLARCDSLPNRDVCCEMGCSWTVEESCVTFCELYTESQCAAMAAYGCLWDVRTPYPGLCLRDSRVAAPMNVNNQTCIDLGTVLDCEGEMACTWNFDMELCETWCGAYTYGEDCDSHADEGCLTSISTESCSRCDDPRVCADAINDPGHCFTDFGCQTIWESTEGIYHCTSVDTPDCEHIALNPIDCNAIGHCEWSFSLNKCEFTSSTTTGTGTTTTPTTMSPPTTTVALSRCNSAYSENECNTLGCAWTSSSMCRVNCATYNYAACETMTSYGCYWDTKSCVGIFENVAFSIESSCSFTTASSCSSNEDCYWYFPTFTVGAHCNIWCEGLSIGDCNTHGAYGCFLHPATGLCNRRDREPDCAQITSLDYCYSEKCSLTYATSDSQWMCYDKVRPECKALSRSYSTCNSFADWCFWDYSYSRCDYRAGTTPAPSTGFLGSASGAVGTVGIIAACCVLVGVAVVVIYRKNLRLRLGGAAASKLEEVPMNEVQIEEGETFNN